MTHTLPQPAAPPRPPRAAAKRADTRPPGQGRATDKITTALAVIAPATPSPLLAPWLPGVLGALARRGEPR